MLIDHGADKDRAWLARIPSILAICERQWGLQTGPRFPSQSPHYVAPAVRADGRAVVVKAHAPNGEFAQEAEALRLFAGRGTVQLLACDPSNEVLLLERLQPDTPLSCVADDEQATSIAATVMRQLWRPVPQGHPFPSVFDWGAGFAHLRQHYGGGSGPFPPALLEEVETLFTELSTSMAEPVLLPEHLSSHQLARLLARRVDQLAEELQVDRARVRGWGVVQAVLAEWWCFEDGGSLCDPALTQARLLTAIKV
jgi:streptomycin 6-kinase